MTEVVQKENRPANAGRPPIQLNSGELKMMLGQCLKMASENKITAHNTWGLPLIEHLDDLIKEDDPTQHTNFQRASVTLDAGVKIYSYRVDSVHTETFKMLGGLGRASGPAGEGGEEGGEDAENDPNASPSKQRKPRRTHELNPEATLESTLEALNVKKFDLAFAVDPLFHKTSAQFDEGGARGLLLNNLSVYRGCDIVFDSMDVPEAAIDESSSVQSGQATEAIDARLELDSALRPVVEAVATRTTAAAASGHSRITPTLDEILCLLGTTPGDGAAQQADAFVASVVEGSGTVINPDCFTNTTASTSGGRENANLSVDVGETDMDADMKEIGVTPVVVGEQAEAELAAEYGGGYDDVEDDAGAWGGDGGGYDHGGWDAGGDDGDGGEGAAMMHEHVMGTHGEASAEMLEDDAINWLISAGNTNTYVTASKGWAGATHWRYRAVGNNGGGKGTKTSAEDSDDDEEFMSNTRKGGRKKRVNEPLDFVTLMMGEGAEEPEYEMLPRRRTTATAASKKKKKSAAAKSLLPEDYHYKAEYLARYALRPRTSVAIIPSSSSSTSASLPYGDGNNGMMMADGYNDEFGDCGGVGGGIGGGYDDEYEGDAYGGGGEMVDFSQFGGDENGAFALQNQDIDIGDQLELAKASHRIEKVDVNYSRAAKQVDVRGLKELMWNGIQQVMAGALQGQGQAGRGEEVGAVVVEFQDILKTVPAGNAAGRIEDLSIHLCFICVLHLANEHGLVVRGVPGLDRLQISNIPTSVME